MNWIVFILAAIALGATFLAIYERRKRLKLRQEAAYAPHDRARNAYVQGEQARAEAAATQMPTSGFFF